MANIKDASREALYELRTALDLLRHGEEAPRAPAPRLEDLRALVAGMRAGGLDVDLGPVDPPGPLPAAVELASYRIVQEALTNVTRHAHARHVTVRVGFQDGVRVEVTDDGAGGERTGGGDESDGASHPSNGIVGMRERAAALGGSVDAGPLAGGGFRVVARLPFAAP